MNDSKRLVTALMAVGLVLALGIGLIVWKVSSPSSGSAPTFQADAVEPAADEERSSSPAAPTRSTMASDSDENADHAPGAEGATEPPAQRGTDGTGGGAEGAPRDPLLPPNAVVNPSTRASRPTQILRPSNVVPTSVASAPDGALLTGPTGAGEPATPGEATYEQPSSPSTSVPVPQTTAPTTSTQSPTESTSPVTPTTATEPTPATEPSPAAIPTDKALRQAVPEDATSSEPPETLLERLRGAIGRQIL
ncbi:hypothetical protein [Corynebacterium liangguodongii]|uniref:hypothetical protein n=1 Tax=Corynebacterium liangguodongii TaxID=2079535 RepID=UPI0011B1FC63|nr:hypothetical protein [Corynebacterium liangguodongii]